MVKRLLVVDDEPGSLRALAKHLHNRVEIARYVIERGA